MSENGYIRAENPLGKGRSINWTHADRRSIGTSMSHAPWTRREPGERQKFTMDTQSAGQPALFATRAFVLIPHYTRINR